jgi:hypothetical protein
MTAHDRILLNLSIEQSCSEWRWTRASALAPSAVAHIGKASLADQKCAQSSTTVYAQPARGVETKPHSAAPRGCYRPSAGRLWRGHRGQCRATAGHSRRHRAALYPLTPLW